MEEHLSYYKLHQQEMNLNRLVHYYKKKLGKEYVETMIKSKGKAESIKTFRVASKLRKKLEINKPLLKILHEQAESIGLIV